MKLYFRWVGIKRDQRGKNHLWGVLDYLEKDRETYIFHAECSSAIVHLRKTWEDVASLVSKKNQKKVNGYVQSTQEHVENKWPHILDDIEMQFLLGKLTYGNTKTTATS